MLARKPTGNGTVKLEHRMQPSIKVKVRSPTFDERGELFLRSSELEKVAHHRMVDAIENGLADTIFAALGFLDGLNLQVNE